MSEEFFRKCPQRIPRTIPEGVPRIGLQEFLPVPNNSPRNVPQNPEIHPNPKALKQFGKIPKSMSFRRSQGEVSFENTSRKFTFKCQV